MYRRNHQIGLWGQQTLPGLSPDSTILFFLLFIVASKLLIALMNFAIIFWDSSTILLFSANFSASRGQENFSSIMFLATSVQLAQKGKMDQSCRVRKRQGNKNGIYPLSKSPKRQPRVAEWYDHRMVWLVDWIPKRHQLRESDGNQN